MTEHPILFSGPMVRAILEGRKTQTRRVIKPQPPSAYNWCGWELPFRRKACWSPEPTDSPVVTNVHSVPVRYMNGDRLWVRERWRAEELPSGLDGIRYAEDNLFRSILNSQEASEKWCEANVPGLVEKGGWRPSIFMPRWASRITLEIVSVRVERVQDISEEDARAEGDVGLSEGFTNRMHFKAIWDLLNEGRGHGWDTNPWVWVVEFWRIPE